MEDGVPSLPKRPESLDEQSAWRSIRRRRRSRRWRPGSWPAGNMAQAQVALHAAAPGADEREIQRSANDRAGQGNQPANPFFSGFLAKFNGQPLGDARGKFLKDFASRQDLCRSQRRLPRLRGHPQPQPFALATVLESV